MNNVVDFFQSDNIKLFDSSNSFVVHSIKQKMKDADHLREKIARKVGDGRTINRDNLFSAITDLAGVRVLHLRLSDFQIIHAAISDHMNGQHWFPSEAPKAYTWDPEYQSFFERIGITSEIKESFYTSVHYVVKPNPDSFVSCEIQVRSLFEEIWGEIDHQLNYPTPSKSIEP